MSAQRAYGLMYHDVEDTAAGPSGRTGTGSDRYKLAWPVFVAHLDSIAAAHPAAPIVADDTFATRPRPGWALTFDDGGASAVVVGEELVRRGWRGHFFLTTGLIGTTGFVDAEAIRELDRLGHVIGSHSVTHPDSMSLLPDEELLREWTDSVDALAQMLGKPVRTASVPGGGYRPNVAHAAARAGITVLFTSEPVRRTRRVGGVLVVGRYSVRRHTSAAAAAAVAGGATAPWLRQWAAWNLRKPVRLIAGTRYDRARRSLLGLRSETPRAGDS